jgi:PAS domain S-box-containing protein
MKADVQKSRAELLQEVTELRQKLKALLESDGLERDDLLCLAVLQRAPLAMWAADRHCRIQLWTEGAARLYGYTAEEAIGADFVDLFVDEPEQEAARKDCVRVIDSDAVFKNFLAGDKTANGQQRLMLTNSFRVYDLTTSEMLQAEVAVDISDLETSRTNFQRLLEVGVALRASQQMTVDLRRAALIARVGQARATRLASLMIQQRNVQEWAKKSGTGTVDSTADAIAQWRTRCDSAEKSIRAAKKVEDLDAREQDVLALEAEVGAQQ